MIQNIWNSIWSMLHVPSVLTTPAELKNLILESQHKNTGRVMISRFPFSPEVLQCVIQVCAHTSKTCSILFQKCVSPPTTTLQNWLFYLTHLALETEIQIGAWYCTNQYFLQFSITWYLIWHFNEKPFVLTECFYSGQEWSGKGKEKHRSKLFPTVILCSFTLQNLSPDTNSPQPRDRSLGYKPLTLWPSCVFLVKQLKVFCVSNLFSYMKKR